MKKLFLIALAAAFFAGCQTVTKLNVAAQWILTEMNGVTLPANAEVTLSFDTAKMEVYGNSACNNYFGSYKLTGNELELSNIGVTRMYCEETDKLEQEYLKTLDGKLQLKTTDSRLEMAKEGKTVLVFVKK